MIWKFRFLFFMCVCVCECKCFANEKFRKENDFQYLIVFIANFQFCVNEKPNEKKKQQRKKLIRNFYGFVCIPEANVH